MPKNIILPSLTGFLKTATLVSALAFSLNGGDAGASEEAEIDPNLLRAVKAAYKHTQGEDAALTKKESVDVLQAQAYILQHLYSNEVIERAIKEIQEDDKVTKFDKGAAAKNTRCMGLYFKTGRLQREFLTAALKREQVDEEFLATLAKQISSPETNIELLKALISEAKESESKGKPWFNALFEENKEAEKKVGLLTGQLKSKEEELKEALQEKEEAEKKVGFLTQQLEKSIKKKQSTTSSPRDFSIQEDLERDIEKGNIVSSGNNETDSLLPKKKTPCWRPFLTHAATFTVGALGTAGLLWLLKLI